MDLSNAPGIVAAIVFGLFTFVSPCVLPLLPVFVTYFTQGKKTTVFGVFIKVLAFVIGLSIILFSVYLALAIVAHGSGKLEQSWIEKYKDQVNAVCGIVLVVLGLKFMGYVDLPFLNKSISYTPKQKKSKKSKNNQENGEASLTEEDQPEGISLISSFIMGLAFSVSLGTCSIGWGVTLTSAITTASNLFNAIMIAVVYILTVDLLFIIFAMLLNQLKGVLKFILRHQNIISKVCGIIMILLGFMIALGFMDKIMASMPTFDAFSNILSTKPAR